MKILVITHNSPEKITLVKLPNRKLIDEIKILINRDMRKKAIKKVLQEGKVLQEVTRENMGLMDAELILTEKTAHYDLM